MKCLTAEDLMCGLGVSLSSNCEKNVCQINAILRRHYSNLADQDIVKSSIGFTGEGIHVLESNNGEDVYKVVALFVKYKDGCTYPSCSREIKDCDNCNKWRTIPVSQSFWDMGVGQYSIEGNKITINVGSDVVEGYVTYSRGPKEISDIKDDICVDPLEIELLQMGILRFRAELEQDFNLANYFEGREYKARENIKRLIEDRIPHSIGIGYTKK